MNDTATSWLQGLAARGVGVTLRNGRLVLHPARAYKELTDAELLTLRHHRASIKDIVRAGPPVLVEALTTSVGVAPTLAPAPKPCRWCGRAPCIGVEHPAFYALHPIEAQQQADAEATAVMMARLRGRP